MQMSSVKLHSQTPGRSSWSGALRKRAVLLYCLVAITTPVIAQDPADSAEWRQQAAAKVEQGKSLYREGRYYEAADAFGWVANVDLWYMQAGPRQIMSLVRAGLADTGSTEALAAATRAFRTLEGFPLPNDLQTEYEAIARALEVRTNAAQQAEVQPEPPPVSQPETTLALALEPEQEDEPANDEGSGTPEAAVQEQPIEDMPDSQTDSSSSSLASGSQTPEPEPQLQPADVVVEEPEQEQEMNEEASDPAVDPVNQSQPQLMPGDIVSLAEVTTQPRLLESEPPVYPFKAQRQRVTGDVTLYVLVGVDGLVERLRFVSVPRESFGFEEAVEDVIGKWRFEPASKNGVVVRTWVPIRIPWE